MSCLLRGLRIVESSAIYIKSRVTNVLPGMQSAFVDIGLERNAFLYVDDALATAELRSVGHDDIDGLQTPSIKDVA